MTPFLPSLKAMEKMPDEGCPMAIGVGTTCQVSPASVERKTRAAPPPVAIQTFFRPCTVMQVPLAAKAASLYIAGGMLEEDTCCQLAPPSRVFITSNRPAFRLLS